MSDYPNVQTTKERDIIRVGDPDSPVLPGDINPTNSLPYRAGQFAPSVDELTHDTLSSAKEAGVLPSDLPIYDESTGEVSAAKVEAWEPEKDLAIHGFQATNLPKYSSAILLSSLKNMGKLPENIGLKTIRGAERTDAQGSGIGTTIIAAVYDDSGPEFTGGLEVYPDFFKYIYVPLAPRVGREAAGVSVATYATFHAIGHLLFARLANDGKLSGVAAVLGDGVWSKTGIGVPGSFMGTQTTNVWRRREGDFPTQLSKSTPSDHFAEIFAIRITNPDYLSTVYPEKHDAMSHAILQYYR